MHKHMHARTHAGTQEDVCAKKNDVRRGKKWNVVKGNREREREGNAAANLGASSGTVHFLVNIGVHTSALPHFFTIAKHLTSLLS